MMSLNPIGAIINGVRGIVDDVHTSDEERLKSELEFRKLDTQIVTGEQRIEETRAKHKSIFVAGARPATIWVGALGLGYQFLLHPLLLWGWSVLSIYVEIPTGVAPPPSLDMSQLLPLVLGSGGVAAMRSYDKSKGTQTDSIR